MCALGLGTHACVRALNEQLGAFEGEKTGIAFFVWWLRGMMLFLFHAFLQLAMPLGGRGEVK